MQTQKSSLPVSSYLPSDSRKSVRWKLRRVFNSFLLLSVAVTLSTLLSLRWVRNLSAHFPGPRVQSSDTIEWKDDVWPIRPPTPWDISTDFPYPRILEYDVQEGTWLRLDVHPKTGDIVFDMAGDLYCLPAQAYLQNKGGKSKISKAHPILVGVPHDTDPHFSPEGDRIVFKSDAELGVDNIWVTKWSGCEEMNVRSSHSGSGSSELAEALSLKDYENQLLASGVKETSERKRRRLIREGRLGAWRVTNETYRYVSDARFHPSGSKVVATKWYTSERSLGAGEGWEYLVPSLDNLTSPVESGSGKRIIGRTLPSGWSLQQYGNQQIGPEQFIWQGEDGLIYSKNIQDESSFTYSKDVHNGIYAIFSRNLTNNATHTLVDAFPGGASRPELSRDGRTLAFVRRVRDKEALVLKDLETGTIHHIWYGLTYDLTMVSAPMGTYPSFAFTPSDDAVIIWAAGQIHHVPLTVNGVGEKVSLGAPTPILFTAHIEKQLAKTIRGGSDLVGLETQVAQRAYAFKELSVDADGKKAVFQAAGMTYVQKIGEPSVNEVPVLHAHAPYYSPSFVYGAEDLVLHARWSDTNFTTFELANLTAGLAHEFVELPLGRYHSPVLCECSSIERRIAFIKTGGDLLTGNIVATAGAGLYIGQITLPSASSRTSQKIAVRNIRFVASDINTDGVVKMRFIEKNSKLLVQQSNTAFIVDLGPEPKKSGRQTLASGLMSVELVVSPKVSTSGDFIVENVAFVDFFNVYVAPGSEVGKEPVWSKPANATKGLARLSLDGGHDITWSRDGKKLFWFLGPFLHSLEVSKLKQCSSSIQNDPSTFGISCIKNLVEYQEVIVEHSTAIQRLRRDAANASGDLMDADVMVITNGTILTMETGHTQTDLISDGILITRGGIIESLGSSQHISVPSGATVINAQGGYVVPGFIDAHAHWDGFSSRYPAKSWEMEVFLAYGVTTLHNPSADNVQGFVERSRIERGQMNGPRVFQVGNIIYGAGSPDVHQDIADMAEAQSALIRIKAEGGPACIAYKNYNLPSRASRQRLLLAARNLFMGCVPEGGMNYDWDLTYIMDGMTTVEHSLPVAQLYDDILTLYAASGTGSTPTHVVNYGGAWGEEIVWAVEDVPDNQKLRRFSRHDILEGLTESKTRPFASYHLYNTSASVANMVGRGLLAHIGAHGEPPLGLNYHTEMFFTQQGGLSNYEVIRAATSSAAKTLGIDSSVGTLSVGKLADLLVYPPGFDLLTDDIRGTRDLVYVVRGGRIWDAESMEEVWPMKGRRQSMPPFNAD